MRKQILKKIKSRSGAGEFISFSISILLLCLIFMTMLYLGVSAIKKVDVEKASQAAARRIVVCADPQTAASIAQETARAVAGNQAVAQIAYNEGSKQKWEKGALIDVLVRYNRLSSVTTVMLEYVPPREN